MDQSTYLQRLRYKVASFGQKGTAASNRYLDHNGSYHTETVAGRALDNTGGYCCEPPTVPEPPFDISGVTVRDPTVQLSFTPGSDGRSPITNYLLSFDGITFTPCSPPVTGPPIFVTDLFQNRLYTTIGDCDCIGGGSGCAPQKKTGQEEKSTKHYSIEVGLKMGA
jgi:hypothetical protein